MTTHVIGRELDRLRQRHGSDDSGSLADYIPELAKADPSWFGTSLCTIDGSVYESGDTDQEFTIQSVSKPFVYALALRDNGPDEVFSRIGVEPSGDAFNSILLDQTNRPHNPMVNAGAIATVALVLGADSAVRFERILELLSSFAGRQLELDHAVFESETNTGHRNRAIAHLMKTVDAIEGNVDEILEVYFKQCSILVTSTDLAVMMATFATGGVNPLSGRRVVSREVVGDVLSVMFTAGMYDYSGEWAYRTGLPAKSGVSGGVAALVPDQIGVGVFSPLIDRRGNSVRGMNVCQELSQRLGFHVFRHRVDALPPIKSVSRGDVRHSLRVRPLAESEALKLRGSRIVIVEIQGPWSFVSCERLMRLVDNLDDDFLIIDTSRMGAVDNTAAILMTDFVESHESGGSAVVWAGTVPAPLLDIAGVRFPTLDEALEWCEDRTLAVGPLFESHDDALPIEASDLGRGLTRDELISLSEEGTTRHVEDGATLTRSGESSTSMYLVTRGHLTAHVGDRRVASFGPGAIVGEMGLLTGSVRSATIRADECCTVLEFTELDRLDPAIRAKVHRNIAVVLAGRLGTTTQALADAHR